MGGKGEQGEQKLRATQDQLRIARITQDSNSLEDSNIQKLIKKVVETTRCSVAQAEIALFDADNNVEEAVNAILEDTYTEANVWKEQKSKKSKKQDNEEKNDEFVSVQRNVRPHSSRGANSSLPRRGRGDRGRGAYRGGVRGTRGVFNGRGGHQATAGRCTGTSGSSNNVWDNSQAKTVQSKEWSGPAIPLVDDTPEDTEWESAGTLVFSRREEMPPAVVPPTSAASAVNSVSTSTVSAPISFAAVAAAGANKGKENHNGPAVSQIKVPTSAGAPVPVLPPSSSPSQMNSVNQPTVDSYSSVYQKNDVVSTSAQLTSTPAPSANEAGHLEEGPDDLSNQPAAPLPSVRMSSMRTTQPAVSTSSVNTNGGSSADWTAQLKNDLGIGTKSAPKPAPSIAKPVTPNKSMQSQAQKSVTQPVNVHQISYSVEFVSDESNESSALPGYQFGFHVDTSSSNDETSEESLTTSKQRTKNEPDLIPGDAVSAILTNGSSREIASSTSAQQQTKITASSSGVGITPVSSSVHSSMGMQRQPATSGLSLADTSSMSYPSPENRSSITKPPLSLHQQQQAQHPLYTTTQFSYGNYPYMNMYSPVTGVRQDEAPYATLVQYPFAGMGQIDMSSLSTMLPPIAPQQQPSQPPPQVQQTQHQQRPDQHGNYVDLKAYATAAGVTISSAAGGTGSGLLSNQQQQQRADTSVTSSTVAPPPGFSGPPSNIPTAAFTLPQPNLSSIFQMPPHYPQLNQLPFSFMLPSVTGNGQHKLGHQIFAQQTVDDNNLSEQRLSSQQQKVYGGGHQQMDKYGSSGGSKDRMGPGAQATPPPQIYQGQAPQGYLPQQVQHHAHNKKSYATSQHWGAS